MRGKPIFLPRLNATLRNIPAYAGKTRVGQHSGACYQEHPRVCGENVHAFRKGAPPGGTSPRMRGKLGTGVAGALTARNIPAYAGKTEGEEV